MHATKLLADSVSLGRAFHADVFTLTPAPEAWVVMFGGSGQTQTEYLARSKTLVPVFDDDLGQLEREGVGMGFVFITAPWDVSFDDVLAGGEVADRWRRHVEVDVLAPLGVSSFYGVGYSGGAALLLSGVHQHPTCFGAGLLGGDALPDDLSLPASWSEPLTAVYNLQDAVYSTNRDVLTGLSEAEVIRVLRQKPGGHEFTSYLRNGSWAGLMRRAWGLWRQR